VGSPDDVAVMETSKGRMVIEFWPKEAPKTVANFKKLARSGFYNGTGFHRIIAGFMVQGGDPKSKNPKAPDLGTGGPGWNIPDEFNDHKHVKGVLSMAHTAEPNSGGSQFFLMHGSAPFLDHKYSAFGHVIEGMDVVDAIANVRTGPNPSMPGENSKPLEWVTVKSVKVLPRAVAMGGGAAAAAKAAGQEKAAAAKNEAAEKAAEKATDAKESAAKAAEAAKKADAKAAEAAQSAAEAAKAAGAPADSGGAK
jgi:peptidyl-prolyl cis-trans isomerase B (cyclophilin B)